MFETINTQREGAIQPLSPKTDALNTGTETQATQSFSSLLDDALSAARRNEEIAADDAERFAKGDPNIGLQETIISAEKASISLRYAVTLKNKLLESYRELMNTPL